MLIHFADILFTAGEKDTTLFGKEFDLFKAKLSHDGVGIALQDLVDYDLILIKRNEVFGEMTGSSLGFFFTVNEKFFTELGEHQKVAAQENKNRDTETDKHEGTQQSMLENMDDNRTDGIKLGHLLFFIITGTQ